MINLPNTVERYRPFLFTEMVAKVVAALPKSVIIAVHTHNDLGMATATTVESFFAGATQMETALNGLGERAGNTIRNLVTGGADAAKTRAQLEAYYNLERGVAYRDAYDAGDRPLISPELQRLMGSRSVTSAMRDAVERAPRHHHFRAP